MLCLNAIWEESQVMTNYILQKSTNWDKTKTVERHKQGQKTNCAETQIVT